MAPGHRAGSEVDTYVTHSLSSSWSYKPKGVQFIIQEMKTFLRAAHPTARFDATYDPLSALFNVICLPRFKKEVDEAFERATHEILKHVDQDELRKISEQKDNQKVELSGDLVKGPVHLVTVNPQDEAEDFAESADYPLEIATYKFRKQWAAINSEPDNVTIYLIVSSKDRAELEQELGITIAFTQPGRQVYLGANSKESIEKGFERLENLLALAKRQHSRLKHVLYAEDYVEKNHPENQMTVDARYIANLSMKHASTILLEPDVVKRDGYREVLTRGVQLRLCKWVPHKKSHMSLIGPKIIGHNHDDNLRPRYSLGNRPRASLKSGPGIGTISNGFVQPLLPDTRKPRLSSSIKSGDEVKNWIKNVPDFLIDDGTPASLPPSNRPSPDLVITIATQAKNLSQATEEDLIDLDPCTPIAQTAPAKVTASPISNIMDMDITVAKTPMLPSSSNPSVIVRNKENVQQGEADLLDFQDVRSSGQPARTSQSPELLLSYLDEIRIIAARGTSTADGQRLQYLANQAKSAVSCNGNKDLLSHPGPRDDRSTEHTALGGSDVPRNMELTRMPSYSSRNCSSLIGSNGAMEPTDSLIDFSDTLDTKRLVWGMRHMDLSLNMPVLLPEIVHSTTSVHRDTSFRRLGEPGAKSHETMKQQTGPSGNEDLRTFADEMETALEDLLKDVPFLRGDINLHTDFGRIFMAGMDESAIAFNNEDTGSEGWKKDRLLCLLHDPKSRPPKIVFGKIISTNGYDADQLALMEPNGQKIWDNRPEAVNIYSFLCLPKDGRPKFRLDIIDEKEDERFSYRLYSPPDENRTVLVHSICRNWDARVMLSYSPTASLEDNFGHFARMLLGSLRIRENDAGLRQIWYGTTADCGIKVVSIRLYTKWRYLSLDKESALEITEVQLADETPCPSVPGSDLELKFVHPWRRERTAFMEKKGIFSSWYEASVVSTKLENVFKENGTLGVGAKASYSFADLKATGALTALYRPALNMLPNMDQIGSGEDNNQLGLLAESLPRSNESAEQAAVSANPGPKMPQQRSKALKKGRKVLVAPSVVSSNSPSRDTNASRFSVAPWLPQAQTETPAQRKARENERTQYW